jgi:hypothetical protein
MDSRFERVRIDSHRQERIGDRDRGGAGVFGGPRHFRDVCDVR